MTAGNSTFCQIFLYYGILIFRTVLPTQTQTLNSYCSWQWTSYFFLTNWKVYFDYCWFFYTCDYHTFLRNKHHCMDHRYEWMQLKIIHLFWNSWRKFIFWRFYKLNKTSIYVSKFSLEACLQVNYGWLFIFQKKVHSLSDQVLDGQLLCQNIDF